LDLVSADKIAQLNMNKGVACMESESFVNVNGTRIHYITRGNGPPMVMIHGLGNGVGEWNWNLEELSRDFTVYAFDLPGHGESENFGYDFNLASTPSLVIGFLRELNIDKPIIIGASLGGLIALYFTIHFPEEVKKIVIISPPGLGREISWFLRFLTIPFFGDLLTMSSWEDKGAVNYFCGEHSSASVKEFFKTKKMEKGRRVTRRAIVRILRKGIHFFKGQNDAILQTASLPNLKNEILIIWGDLDRVFPVSHAKNAANLLPNSRVCILKGVGHLPHIERPQEFNRVVREFASSRATKVPNAKKSMGASHAYRG